MWVLNFSSSFSKPFSFSAWAWCSYLEVGRNISNFSSVAVHRILYIKCLSSSCIYNIEEGHSEVTSITNPLIMGIIGHYNLDLSSCTRLTVFWSGSSWSGACNRVLRLITRRLAVWAKPILMLLSVFSRRWFTFWFISSRRWLICCKAWKMFCGEHSVAVSKGT